MRRTASSRSARRTASSVSRSMAGNASVRASADALQTGSPSSGGEHDRPLRAVDRQGEQRTGVERDCHRAFPHLGGNRASTASGRDPCHLSRRIPPRSRGGHGISRARRARGRCARRTTPAPAGEGARSRPPRRDHRSAGDQPIEVRGLVVERAELRRGPAADGDHDALALGRPAHGGGEVRPQGTDGLRRQAPQPGNVGGETGGDLPPLSRRSRRTTRRGRAGGSGPRGPVTGWSAPRTRAPKPSAPERLGAMGEHGAVSTTMATRVGAARR